MRIVSNLPTMESPLLPQVKDLPLRVTVVASVNLCGQIRPLGTIEVDRPFVPGEGRQFLAVRGLDRE